MNWTTEQTTMLRIEWHEGASSAALAKLIGVTRNAIIGKLHRLGLRDIDRRKHPHHAGGWKLKWQRDPQAHQRAIERRIERQKSAEQRRQEKTWVRMEKKFNIPLDQIEHKPTHLLDLKHHQCRFVIGNPADLLFCGADRVHDNSSYCERHHLGCTVPPKSRMGNW